MLVMDQLLRPAPQRVGPGFPNSIYFLLKVVERRRGLRMPGAFIGLAW